MNSITRRVLLASTLIIIFSVGIAIGQNKFGQPKSVLHIVTVKWKEELTSAGRQPSIDSRGEVIVGGEDAIEAHSLGTGKLRWSFPVSGGVPLIIKATGKEIIFTSHDNTVTALR